MRMSLRVAVIHSSLFAVLFACAGCGDGTDGGQAVQEPRRVAEAPPPPTAGRVEAETASRVSEGAGTSPTIKAIMATLTKGPNSLTPVIGKELKDDPPPWETIQPQTQEYARLAAALGQNEPSKGTKESWANLTADYARLAAELDRAAQAKDKDAALAAHEAITKSCMACHREHRKMGPGMGGPPGGGPGGFPGGPGGPPPGGPPPE